MRFSLRSQLSLWVGLTILVIVFSAILVTQQITVWSLENSLDENLQKRGYMVASIISSDITADEADYASIISDLASQEFSFVSSQLRVISPIGSPIVEFGKMTDAVIQDLNMQLQSPEVDKGFFYTIQPEGVAPLRSYTLLVTHPRTRSNLAYVQIIDSLDQLEGARQNLWRNGILIGLVGSALAIIIGQILIRRGFKPLYSIVAAIDEADYNHLKSSMKEGGPEELEQLAKSLSAMWMRLDMAVSEKQKAIGNLSHDLRTPLTALQGQLEILLSQPGLSVENRNSLERMLNETQRLARMVKNMLLNVQLESKPYFVAEEVNLKDIVDIVVREMWVLAEGLKFEIVASADLIISGGRDLLIQMLMNIVDNAIKFTPKGGKIELKLISEDGWALLQVIDTGRGIPADHLPHVMEAYYKVSLSRKSEGEGARLGLAIVKQIVDLHQGNIGVQSRLGSGTIVTVRLPLKNRSGFGESRS
jgi:two-component system, OmpR family, sensor kinase